MEHSPKYGGESRGDLKVALSCVRQASLALPEDFEELKEDLKWVEESMEEMLTEAEDTGELFGERIGA